MKNTFTLFLFAVFAILSYGCSGMYPGLNSVQTSTDSMSGSTSSVTTLMTQADSFWSSYSMTVQASRSQGMTGTYLQPSLRDHDGCHSDILEISINGNYTTLQSNQMPEFTASSPNMIVTSRSFPLTSNYQINPTDNVVLRWCGRQFTIRPGSVERLADIHAMQLDVQATN
jgi:hypothetical protein